MVEPVYFVDFELADPLLVVFGLKVERIPQLSVLVLLALLFYLKKHCCWPLERC